MSAYTSVNPRERFKNKKKAKSFQAAKPIVQIDLVDGLDTHHETKNNSAPNTPKINVKFRSRSTADANYLLHNAVITEDAITLKRVLEDFVIEEKKINIDNVSTTGMTALHQACLLGNLKCVELLVEAGSNLYVKTRDNLSALQLAVTCGNFEVAEYLLSKGVTQDDIKEGVQYRRLSSCI